MFANIRSFVSVSLVSASKAALLAEALLFFNPTFRSQVEKKIIKISNQHLERIIKLDTRYYGKIRSIEDIDTLIKSFRL